MAHFWSKLGLGRNKGKERLLHEGTEPIKLSEVLTEASQIHIPKIYEVRDIPVVDVTKWTVDSIRSAVAGHVGGTFSNGAMLGDAMMADDRIQGATNGRTKGVTKRALTFTPSKKTMKSVHAEHVAMDLESFWSEVLPESTVEDILKWQIFSGFCLNELIWECRNDKWIPRIKVWHPLYIYYNLPTRQYVAMTMDGIIHIEPNDPKWALYTPYGSYRGWMRGAVRSVSIPWLVRQFALRDWARYSEVHGLPQKKAKVPSQAPVEDKRRFFNQVKRLGSESAFLLPVPMNGGGEWDVDLLEARDDSWKAFDGLIDRCDKSITLTIRGTNLTTEVSTGTGAATEAHRDEDSDYAASDCRKLAEFLQKQILAHYCLYNYGDANIAPVLSFESEPVENRKLDADTMVTVAGALTAFRDLGWVIKKQEIAEKFQIPLDLAATEEAEKEKKAAASGKPGEAPPKETKSGTGGSADAEEDLPEE